MIRKHTDQLPMKRYDKRLKPYWNTTLKKLCKIKKTASLKWKQAGGKKDGSPEYEHYKMSKRQVQHALREAKFKYEADNMEELTKSNEIDQNLFWSLVNRKKKQRKYVHPIRISEQETLTNPKDILNSWKEYYQALYTNAEMNQFNQQFKHEIESRLKQIENDSNLPINDLWKYDLTIKEVNTVINSFKMRKAPGFDNITAECFMHCGPVTRRTILNLFNAILRYEFIPRHLKRGILISIPKGQKSQLYRDNYRGITLLTVISKLFEKCIMNRMNLWALENNVIINIQGAMQSHCSSLHAAWVVKEVIADRTMRNSITHVVMLDIKKCFDTIWHDGVFLKLHEVGIRGKTWRILRNMYQSFICNVRLQNELSEDILIERGLHQGAPCSMFLFTIFINGLLNDLQAFYPCIKLCSQVVNCMAFADDITILASCKVDLQDMINIAYRYSCRWRFEFNPVKCIVLTFSKTGKQSISVKMGPHKLKSSKCESLLGLPLATTKASERSFIEGRVSKCRSMVYSALSLGSRDCPLSPTVASKLYTSACLPKLLYGYEVMNLDDSSVQALESFQVSAAKTFQGLPNNACNLASVGAMGWTSIRSMIDTMKLRFLWQLLLLPTSSLYKLLVLRIIFMLVDTDQIRDSSSPIANMLKVCIKYELLNDVIQAITNGHYIPLAEWKRKIKDIVSNRHMRCYKIECKLYISLDLYNPNDRISIWWKYGTRNPKDLKKCMLILKLLLNCYRLGKKRCNYCNDHNNSNLPHILFECHSVHTLRDHLWRRIGLNNQNVFEAMNNMDTYSRCKFLLNGFNSDYVSEWDTLYSDVISFIAHVYQQYYREYMQINH